MILNHVDLQVSNVSAARAFFERHVGLRCTYQRAEQIALLEDDAGFCFGVSNLRNGTPPALPARLPRRICARGCAERTGDIFPHQRGRRGHQV
jgi:hypothetical protein